MHDVMFTHIAKLQRSFIERGGADNHEYLHHCMILAIIMIIYSVRPRLLYSIFSYIAN